MGAKMLRKNFLRDDTPFLKKRGRCHVSRGHVTGVSRESKKLNKNNRVTRHMTPCAECHAHVTL